MFELRITAEAEDRIQSIMHDASKKGLQKQLKKALGYLQHNPRHPGLNSHPLINSEEMFGVKIWTSYVQSRTPQAHRILWTHGKEGRKEIVVLAVIPHY